MPSILELLDAGKSHFQARRYEDARRVCREILRRDRRHADAMYLLALSFYFGGDIPEAISWLRKVILIDGRRAIVFANLGTMCAAIGQKEDAARYHRRAVEIEPGNASYLSNLGLAMLNVGDAKNAVDFCRKALQIDPNLIAARNNLGLALHHSGDLNGAVQQYRQMVEKNPADSITWGHLVNVLQERGDVDEMIVAAQKWRELNPDESGAHRGLLFASLYSPALTPEQIFAQHRRWAERFMDPLDRPTARRIFSDASRERKIRVGYMSADFHQHPAMNFFEPVLIHHDVSRFEIYCYSASTSPDAVTARLRRYPHTWRTIAPLSDEQIVNLIRSDEIDILVDMIGYSSAPRPGVYAQRPAAVQISYLAYPATTGMRQMDYLITDQILDEPGDERFYTEKLIRLPRTFAPYLPFADSPAVVEPPADVPIIFVSQHHLLRLNHSVLSLWARIMERIPNSRLLIARHTLDEKAQSPMRQRCQRAGLDVSRLDMHQINKTDHLLNYGRGHIMLDTFPWSGHTSGCEALWMGCPVVTLKGPSRVGRHMSSVVTQLKLIDLIAGSPEDYVDIAVSLANNAQRRSKLRRNLRDMMKASPLMDYAGFTRDLEAAYIAAIAEKSAST